MYARLTFDGPKTLYFLNMQTILGSGGAIGTELAKALSAYTSDIRLVSRHPKKVNETDTLHPADLSNPAQIDRAIAGSSICYVCVGFEYKTSVWQNTWPAFMQSVADACMRHNCKLVFFDNIYALSPDQLNPITEASAVKPVSKKGLVRAQVDRIVLDGIKKGQLQAIIARAPDFFGPVKKENSLLMNLVYDNLAKGKAAQWFCNADVPHSMGYTPDLAKGTAILGNSPEAYQQIWNLPVDKVAPNGREWAGLFAKEMQVKAKITVLPKWMVTLLGIFVPVLREMPEMMYQNDRSYVFDSSKFCTAFNYTPTGNAEAVKQTIAALKG